MGLLKMCNQLLVALVLLISFTSSANSLCSTLLKNTRYDKNEVSDCWILFQKFQEDLVEQSENLYNLSQILFPTSRIPPVIVSVSYNVHICGCYMLNHTQGLGWTSKSLYNNFDGEIINQIPLQVPYLVLHLLECLSGLEDQPYVDDFLWAGGQRKLPEVHLTLNVSILQNLTVTLLKYNNFNSSLSSYNQSLSKCPSNETIKHALEELNQWVSLQCYLCILYYGLAVYRDDPEMAAPINVLVFTRQSFITGKQMLASKSK